MGPLWEGKDVVANSTVMTRGYERFQLMPSEAVVRVGIDLRCILRERQSLRKHHFDVRMGFLLRLMQKPRKAHLRWSHIRTHKTATGVPADG